MNTEVHTARFARRCLTLSVGVGYLAAAVTAAHKGQVCLDECFRVLQPHEHIIPANVLEDLNALKTSGIQQVARIYDLLYSGQKADVNAHSAYFELSTYT